MAIQLLRLWNAVCRLGVSVWGSGAALAVLWGTCRERLGLWTPGAGPPASRPQLAWPRGSEGLKLPPAPFFFLKPANFAGFGRLSQINHTLFQIKRKFSFVLHFSLSPLRAIHGAFPPYFVHFPLLSGFSLSVFLSFNWEACIAIPVTVQRRRGAAQLAELSGRKAGCQPRRQVRWATAITC